MINALDLVGYGTALVTPFKEGNSPSEGPFQETILDEEGLAALLEAQIDAGMKYTVLAGTTGEYATLSEKEYFKLLALGKEITQGRMKVVAGLGGNDSLQVYDRLLKLNQIEVDGYLISTPYYNKPSPAGVEAHYTALLQASNKPVILYDVPGRTGIAFTADVLSSLISNEKVIGLKDARGDVAMLQELESRRALKKDFAYLSGSEEAYMEYLTWGAVGCISVAANVEPRACIAFHEAWSQGKGSQPEVLELYRQLSHLTALMFKENSPAPAKAALNGKGLIERTVRRPLIEASFTVQAELSALTQEGYFSSFRNSL